MVWRLEKTDRSDMFVGHDWILSMSANGDVYSFSTKLHPARIR